ncbi:hypothetical protein LTR35_017583 [Friedmanniomyces endolithicus]|uniref:Uncharacterized protein n=1 Tax=Friedmanniomyces endolithicus TaxID=329885 RepID=A0AAN6F874_9PEZI|nr:hypothetical protein LTR35_017583 [Friedmanniomyces endolithicus]KAK0267240.1 hypothetical protein LTS00_017840 [Friedmanniomyces endolithicus]KAK0304131.1 hypothetical protein LTR82_017306 [Friedmanniomyces endolithicus]KAK0972383.1 hypothetical protein LTR54_017582 [Friedmanniomyces endolithicus]
MLSTLTCEIIVPSDPPVNGFPIDYDGFGCNTIQRNGLVCQHIVRTRRGIQDHCAAQHGWVNEQRRGGHATLKQIDSPNRTWTTNVGCQTFFQHPKWLRYFQVTVDTSSEPEETEQSRHQQSDFFATQRADIALGREDAVRAANYVEGFDQHHSTVVPWLQTTGIADHVCGLRKNQIQSAVTLPNEKDEPILHIIAVAMQDVLETAHCWCSDGPDCKLSWRSRIALSRFQGPGSEATGKMKVFAPNKRPSNLKKYFALALRFLAYLYRITQGANQHFDVADETHGPDDVVQLTTGQQQAWQAIVQSASQQRIDSESKSESEDSDSDNPAHHSSNDGLSPRPLQDRLVNLWMLLLTHDTAARRYSSPLVSFCAILSIQPTTGSWMKPGNFSSDLSKMAAMMVRGCGSGRRETDGPSRL